MDGRWLAGWEGPVINFGEFEEVQSNQWMNEGGGSMDGWTREIDRRERWDMKSMKSMRWNQYEYVQGREEMHETKQEKNEKAIRLPFYQQSRRPTSTTATNSHVRSATTATSSVTLALALALDLPGPNNNHTM